ncbi:MAG: SDR family oxidoreductase, partial [Acidimicrobiaceae bacterium]|nr:SDR family oxidoreductase [Acidimicrobiaceae bacterium]
MSAIELRGAVAVVSGASSGLGRRFAVDLAAAGAVVTGLARRESLLASLREELQRHSPHSATLVCDVSDTTHYASALADIEGEHGRIDVLINNAGIGEPPDDTGEPLMPYRAVMETNFFAAVTGTLAVLPGMLDRWHGAIVNVSSDTGRAPGPGETAYGASKAALSAFTESISYRAERRGVRVHVLYPGWVPTAMGSRALDGGRPPPPRMVRRTEEQVSRLLLARLGGSRVDIDAAPIARLAPVGRS